MRPDRWSYLSWPVPASGTGGDTPASRAASSLERPVAIAAQNRTSSSRRAESGRPGECNLLRPDRSDRRLHTVIATSYARVLRRPIELALHTAIAMVDQPPRGAGTAAGARGPPAAHPRADGSARPRVTAFPSSAAGSPARRISGWAHPPAATTSGSAGASRRNAATAPKSPWPLKGCGARPPTAMRRSTASCCGLPRAGESQANSGLDRR